MLNTDEKHKLKKISIVEEEMNELNGWKLEVELAENVYEDNYWMGDKKVGEAHAYILDDRLGNLFLAADEHSQRLCDFVSDTEVMRELDEKYGILERLKPKYTNIHHYLNGEKHKVVGLAGRVLIIDFLSLEEQVELSVDELTNIIKHLIQELGMMFSLDFILMDNHSFPETSKFKEKKYSKILLDCGFVKTGSSSYISKINND